MTALGVIPARYASTRFPGKPLALIGEKPMIQHVYEKAIQAETLREVVVATDDARIVEAVQAFGGNVILTRDDHETGSDRLAEVAAQHSEAILVNIQGDEPFISPEAIDRAVAKLVETPQADVGTLVTRFRRVDEFLSANTAKVILDKNDFALYFSRAQIPFFRDCDDPKSWLEKDVYFQHIGLYVYRRDFLLKFVEWPPGRLEHVEKLEQLRVLENGHRIVCAKTEYASFCVDTPEDLEKAQQIWKEQARAN